ncbi:unnamed protein product [marine sediment metagenome]|uniref:PFL domain-containing protein n=1 Tax=marine sediment metagenome TaxID=412755 RepID=X1GX89_9ZZZZ
MEWEKYATDKNDTSKSKEQFGPKTGDPENFETWEDFWNA